MHSDAQVTRQNRVTAPGQARVPARAEARVTRLTGVLARSAVGLACALALVCATPATGTEIERILAVVDGRPLLLSEVELARDVKRLDRQATVEALIDEWLMFQEAARLPQSTVDEDLAYRSLLENLPDLVVAEGQESALRRMARRQATILRYIEFRFRPLVRIDDAQVRQAYQERHGTQPDAPAFASVEAELRDHLARRDLDEKIEAWVRDLRDHAQVRYN